MDIEPDKSYVTHGPALLSRAALHCGLFRTQGNPRPAKRRPVLLSAGPARSRSTPCVHADYAAGSSPQRSPSTATPSAPAPSARCSKPDGDGADSGRPPSHPPRPPRSARPRGAAPMTWRRWPRTTRRPDLPARQPTLRAPLLADNHQPAPSSDGAPSSPNASCAVAPIDRSTHHAEILLLEGHAFRKREAAPSRQERPAASWPVKRPTRPPPRRRDRSIPIEKTAVLREGQQRWGSVRLVAAR